jgi:hypothetical protein
MLDGASFLQVARFADSRTTAHAVTLLAGPCRSVGWQAAQQQQQQQQQ